MSNTIYLFYPDSFVGWCIATVTRSPYSHAAISINGKLYDSSEKRGSFGLSQVSLTSRQYEAYYVEGNLDLWLINNMGRKYDWKGVFGWFWGKQSKQAFYCFEAIYSALYQLDQRNHCPFPIRINGTHIENVLISLTKAST